MYFSFSSHGIVWLIMQDTQGGQGYPGGDTSKEWLTAKEVIAYAWQEYRYHIKDPKTVRRWKNSGDFPVAWQNQEIESGSRLIFKRQDLDPFLEKKKSDRMNQVADNEEKLDAHPGTPLDTQGRPEAPKAAQGDPGVDNEKEGEARDYEREIEDLKTKLDLAKGDVKLKDELIVRLERMRKDDQQQYHKSMMEYGDKLRDTALQLGHAKAEVLRLSSGQADGTGDGQGHPGGDNGTADTEPIIHEQPTSSADQPAHNPNQSV